MIVNDLLTLPQWVSEIIHNYDDHNKVSSTKLDELKSGLQKFKVASPEVSIGIPVYNEEKDLLKMLASFARMTPKKPTELLVINNNSTDATADLLKRLDVVTINEKTQGISFARQAGLQNAKGKYFLNADGDSIYPQGWIDCYVGVLQNPEIVCAYGTYSFIPGKNNSRFALALYESGSRALFNLRRKKMDFFNVLGFNFAFRREDGLRVGGFNTSRQRWSDGWMAMTLAEFGRIEKVTDEAARVWTSDRRLAYDGGLYKAILKRVTKEKSRYTETPDFDSELTDYKKSKKNNP